MSNYEKILLELRIKIFDYTKIIINEAKWL